MATYYNEIDPFAAAWLRNLIKAGLISDGEVDERSIIDVRGDDLRGFRRCHFFAGIGGWDYALQLARWPDDAEVWTGSCPCQPFSVAGQQKADNDKRDLWPAFYRLIQKCRPTMCFGEQVAGALGYQWLAGVRSQLEGSGYRVGAANLPACGVSAPHRRERIFWGAVADASQARRSEHAQLDGGALYGCALPDWGHAPGCGDEIRMADAASGGPLEPIDAAECGTGVRETQSQGRGGGVAHADGSERRTNTEGRRDVGDGSDAGRAEANRRCSVDSQIDDGGRGQRASADRGAGGVGDASMRRWDDVGSHVSGPRSERQTGGSGRELDFWSDAEWITGADGKARRIPRGFESDIRRLVDELPPKLVNSWFGREGETVPLLVEVFPNRVGLLRGYGNAIIPALAAEFVMAFSNA